MAEGPARLQQEEQKLLVMVWAVSGKEQPAYGGGVNDAPMQVFQSGASGEEARCVSRLMAR